MSFTEVLSERGLCVRTSHNQRKRNKMKSKQQSPGRRLVGLALAAVFAILLSGHSQSVSAQWTTTGNNISNSNTGNVGIGTTSPGAKVHISGAASGVSPSSTFAQVAVENSGSSGVQIMNPDNQIGRIMFGTPSAVGSGGSQPGISALIRWA